MISASVPLAQGTGAKSGCHTKHDNSGKNFQKRHFTTGHRLSSTSGNDENGSMSGDSKDGQLHCPKCGQPNTYIRRSTLSASFVQCNKCHHFFAILPGRDAKYAEETEKKDVLEKKHDSAEQPPAPKKIYEYLSKYVVGQEHAKKVLSVAVYNHYKRLSVNIPAKKKEPQVAQSLRYPLNAQQRASLRSATDFVEIASGVNPYSPLGTHKKDDDHKSSSIHGTSQLDSASDAMKIDKSNVLLLGPTGSGKTLLAQTIARCLDVPFAICDCTSLTQAGYVGEDIESVITKLLMEANGDVDRAQRGIVFLDEIDKITSVSGFQQVRDVGGEGVQQGLLKILEGTVVNVPEKPSKKMKGESIPVDTSNILFVASGAFNGLDQIIKKRKQEKVFGFGPLKKVAEQTSKFNLSDISDTETQADLDEKDQLLAEAEARDLINFGMIPEFCGRLPVLVSIHSLSEDSLIKILCEPRNALVPQYQHLFEMDKVNLSFSDCALKKIAEIAKERKTGARGLRAVMEKILLDPMFEVPGSEVTDVIITADVVSNKKKADYVTRSQLPNDEIEEDEDFSNNLISASV